MSEQRLWVLKVGAVSFALSFAVAFTTTFVLTLLVAPR